MSHRTARVADAIREEIAKLLLGEIKDPRVQLVNVSRVEVSNDLSHAKIWFSVLGEEEERESAMEGLESARGFIRREIGNRVRLRTTPELAFYLDRGAEHSQRISDLLEELE